MLSIPDDTNGVSHIANSHSGSRSSSRSGSQKRPCAGHISIQNLDKFVDDGNQILRSVSMDIMRGQVYCIIGPSGSGKSTLLRAINRLWEPPADSIFLDGEDIVKMNVLAVRRRVGMLFQTPMLFDGKVLNLIVLSIFVDRICEV